MIEFEQPESPAAFAVAALSGVDAPAATGTGIPAPVNCETLPLAAGAPAHVTFVKTFTAVGSPPPTVPFTNGVASLAGDVGSVAVMTGGSGRTA